MHTQRCVTQMASHLSVSVSEMRALPRAVFAARAKAVLWRQEYEARWVDCCAKVRLHDLGREVAELRTRDDFMARTTWPGAPYKRIVDDRYHVRLLAQARLGLLPIEVETGRWAQCARLPEQRLCALGCGCVGDLPHFLHGCRAILHDPIDSVAAVHSTGHWREVPPELWRGIATRIASRWYTRIGLLRAADRTAGEEAELDRYEAQLAMHPASYERSDIRAYLHA